MGLSCALQDAGSIASPQLQPLSVLVLPQLPGSCRPAGVQAPGGPRSLCIPTSSQGNTLWRRPTHATSGRGFPGATHLVRRGAGRGGEATSLTHTLPLCTLWQLPRAPPPAEAKTSCREGPAPLAFVPQPFQCPADPVLNPPCSRAAPVSPSTPCVPLGDSAASLDSKSQD